jgi:hypothetical protein
MDFTRANFANFETKYVLGIKVKENGLFFLGSHGNMFSKHTSPPPRFQTYIPIL